MENVNPFKIFIGWDRREDIAYQVAKKSIEDRASIPVEIIPLKQHELRDTGIYTRPTDKLASTEFTFTRYLVPYLADYKGWALFIDCDFLFLDDVAKLVEQIDDSYAIMCAQHQYTPKPGRKMDGKLQTIYPKKNWSSMMLINCEHPKNIDELTLNNVNNENLNGAHFHRFSWLPDSSIGQISHEWNWLVGWYNEPDDGAPKALHYTEGGPWFDNYKDCEYAAEWNSVAIDFYKNELDQRNSSIRDLRNRDVTISDINYSDDIKAQVTEFTHSLVDPENKFFKKKVNEDMKKKSKVAAINTSEINLTHKGETLEYDNVLSSLAFGSNGYISSWEDEKESDNALIIRGVGKKSREAIQHCWNTNRDFYYIDTGYFGNPKLKMYHRLTKNNLQFSSELIDRPDDRLVRTNTKIKKHNPGSKILICPPSDKVMMIFDMPDAKTWTQHIVEEIKKYTDRPIEVRLKPESRTERQNSNTIQDALADAHCLVTYNSIAATEALINGVPAIALGPNAASMLCPNTLENIDNIEYPDRSLIYSYLSNLAYNQFTERELRNGTAWRIINESN
jgi:lipopolysaccharide biosynthesis glycosyltransferase